jgi:glycosyltransferase involved in cell wall biosynthesis
MTQWFPRISVIIPSLNQGLFLNRTLESIVRQNYPSLEIILIDGGSGDMTREIIRKYEKHLAYWVSERDEGQSHALNKGLAVSTGEFVGWMNSDDIYWGSAFAEFAVLVNDLPDFDVYYANKLVVDEKGKVLRRVRYVKPAKGYMEFYTKYRGIAFCNQSAFFRSSVFKEVGLFDQRFHVCMDLDFFYRCIVSGKRLIYNNSIWGAWRWHVGAKTATVFSEDPRRLRERAAFKAKHHIYNGFGNSYLSLVAGAWRRLLLLKDR